MRRQHKRALDENPNFQQQQTFEGDADGVRLSNPLTSTFWIWANFVGVIETPNLLLLQLSDKTALPIPKRAAGDESGLHELRALLATHVSPRTGAFPVLPVQADPDVSHERVS